VRLTGTADPSRPDAGYDVRIGARSVRITRKGVTVATTEIVDAVHPGNPAVYGYIIGFTFYISVFFLLKYFHVLFYYRQIL
jgi:hypothetical protein